ncbi:hypothetical protein [Tetragenococcus solitarius]|uniref:Chloride channel protein n=1 Tax=Tetragenococcus solitarius TaxID=71453 RepID=A0ABN3YEW0_9ENTE|nr:hypothetical protein [Tetragenococcus solitarius]
MLKKLYATDQTRLFFILKGGIVGLVSGIVVSIFRLAIEKMTAYIQELYLITVAIFLRL